MVNEITTDDIVYAVQTEHPVAAVAADVNPLKEVYGVM
jgi:hypothetical protein